MLSGRSRKKKTCYSAYPRAQRTIGKMLQCTTPIFCTVALKCYSAPRAQILHCSTPGQCVGHPDICYSVCVFLPSLSTGRPDITAAGVFFLPSLCAGQADEHCSGDSARWGYRRGHVSPNGTFVVLFLTIHSRRSYSCYFIVQQCHFSQ